MIGIILALALSTHCINTGEDRSGVLLTCDNAQRTELRIPISEWPVEWHGPELGFSYEINALGQPVPTDRQAWRQRMEKIRENSARERRRWRIPALQQPRGQ